MSVAADDEWVHTGLPYVPLDIDAISRRMSQIPLPADMGRDYWYGCVYLLNRFHFQAIACTALRAQFNQRNWLPPIGAALEQPLAKQMWRRLREVENLGQFKSQPTTVHSLQNLLRYRGPIWTQLDHAEPVNGLRYKHIVICFANDRRVRYIDIEHGGQMVEQSARYVCQSITRANYRRVVKIVPQPVHY